MIKAFITLLMVLLRIELHSSASHETVAESPTLFLIVHQKFMGDANQVRGVAEELKSTMASQKTIELDDGQDITPADISLVTANPHNIVITSGLYGAQAIKAIKAKNIAIFTVHLSHQYVGTHHALLLEAKTNLMALPTHIASPAIRHACHEAGILLIETIGVSHNLKPELLESSYESLKSFLPATPFDVVIAPGDTANKEGVSVPFTLEMAIETTEKLAPHLANRIVLINGLRTGKTLRKEGEVDPITQAIQKKLHDSGKTVALFDITEKPAGYKAVLHAIKLGEAASVWVSGESTSMISEVTDTAPFTTRVMGYYQPVMTETHTAHLESERKAGRLAVFDGEHISEPAKSPEKAAITPKLSAAQCIAEAILKARGA